MKSWLMMLVACLAGPPLLAATVTIYTNDFESYTTVATSLADETTDADPIGLEWNMADDTPLGAADGSGVQVIDWLPGSGGGTTKALLLRSGTQAQIYLHDARSGSRYQLDFWVYSVKTPPANRGWYILLRGMGSDINGDDYLAYQSLRDSTTNTIRYYDGVGPGTAAWVNTGIPHATDAWQHHRIVINPNALTFDVYLDNMDTPVLTGGELSRCEVGVPTIVQLLHEGNTADDGYAVIDDLRVTVDDAVDLATTFADGFESYPARVNADDDADPQGSWITTEVDGTGAGRVRAQGKVQVVDSSVVTPHSGTKCLKLEAGQRAGSTIAWGLPSQSDVEITWWARVPASVDGQVANYLRMSLYGAENGNTVAGDNALLGYGSRDATTGDETSLTYFAVSGWYDSGIDYTPNAWEEYRLITYTAQGRYSLIKNPSSASPQVIVDRAPFINGATNWSPVFMAGWSSSNGTNHPPVYVDDIEIKAVTSVVKPLPVPPYTSTFHSTHFNNVTKLTIPAPVGGVAVDPRDNTTILLTLDTAAASGGGIYQARKIASGNWAVDPTPVVGNLANPSGLAAAQDGTLWWVHDFTMSLQRLKAPWASNTPETVVTNFGYRVGDDDPIDVCIAPASFNGSVGKPNCVVVADRGCDTDATNALYVIDPTTTALNQSYETNGAAVPAGWWQFLLEPTTIETFGTNNLNAIAPLPASGEVVVLNQDGYITAVDGNGSTRYIYPSTFWPLTGPIPSGAAIAVDPTTGRLWLADDALDEIWSVDPASGADQKELSFPTIRPEWVDQRVDVHDPGMVFAPNGSFLVVSDTSIINGGGRLLIFHNESIVVPDFSLSSVARVPQGVLLNWQSAGGVKYDVLRGTDLASAASYQAIATNLTATTYTDTNAPAGAAFYRVVAKP
jgi:hypothetical protein